MEKKEIAQTILEQIKATDPMALMAWGAKRLVALGEEKLPNGSAQIGGLQFHVNGLKYKGVVVVRLTHKDLYDIEIGRPYKGQWRSKKYVADVFCEELMQTIDEMIERDYKAA